MLLAQTLCVSVCTCVCVRMCVYMCACVRAPRLLWQTCSTAHLLQAPDMFRACALPPPIAHGCTRKNMPKPRAMLLVPRAVPPVRRQRTALRWWLRMRTPPQVHPRLPCPAAAPWQAVEAAGAGAAVGAARAAIGPLWYAAQCLHCATIKSPRSLRCVSGICALHGGAGQSLILCALVAPFRKRNSA